MPVSPAPSRPPGEYFSLSHAPPPGAGAHSPDGSPARTHAPLDGAHQDSLEHSMESHHRAVPANADVGADGQAELAEQVEQHGHGLGQYSDAGLADVEAYYVQSPSQSPSQSPPHRSASASPAATRLARGPSQLSYGTSNSFRTLKGVLKTSGLAGGPQRSLSGSETNPPPPRVALTDPMADMRQRNIDPVTGRPLTSRGTTPYATPVAMGSTSPQAVLPEPPQRAGEEEGGIGGERGGGEGGGGGGGGAGYFDAVSSTFVGSKEKDAATPISDTESVLSMGEDYNDEDEFNWSDDEAVEEAAKFEEALSNERRVRIGRFSLVAIFKFMCFTFLGNLIISIILIGPVLGLHFGYRPKSSDHSPVAEHRRYISDNVEAWFIWCSFNLHISWWLHAMVGILPRLVIEGIRLVWGSVNQRIKSLGEAYNTLKPAVTPILYAAAAWASWEVLFDPCYSLYSHGDPHGSRASYTYRIYQLMEFYFFITLTYCIEQMIIKLIAIHFHQTAYCERIVDVTNALKTFDTLKDHRPRNKKKGGKFIPGPGGQFYPTPDLQNIKKRFSSALASGNQSAAGSRPVSIDMTTVDISGPGTTPAVSSPLAQTPPALAGQHPPGTYGQRLRALRGQAGRLGSRATSMGRRGIRVGQTKALEMAKVAVQNPFDLLSSKTVGVSVDINSPTAAKRLAKTIFTSYRGSAKRAYLIPSDFEPAFSTPAAAAAAFAVFDRDGNGDVSQAEVKNTVLSVYKERRMLSRSMQDVNHAVHQLDSVFMFVLAIIILFEALSIFRVNIQKTLSSFYSLIIAFGFIFQESAGKLFDSIIFLFVTHPFDTGDRVCFIGADGTPTVMVVKQMALLSTVFLQWDNTELYVANSLLSTLSITNYRRSGYQAEIATLQLGFDTPQEKLDAVEEDMNHWLSTEPARLFTPSTSIVPVQYDYLRSIEVSLTMIHRRNWQDWGARWASRNAFVAALLFYCRKHGVRYAEAKLPIVYVREELAAQCAPPAYNESNGARDTQPILPWNLGGHFPPGWEGEQHSIRSSDSNRSLTDDEDGGSHSDAEEELADPLQRRDTKRSRRGHLQRRKTFNIHGTQVSSLYDDSFDQAVRAAQTAHAGPAVALAGDPSLRFGGTGSNQGSSTGLNTQATSQVNTSLPASAALMNFVPPPDEFGGNSVMRRRTANRTAQRLAVAGGG